MYLLDTNVISELRKSAAKQHSKVAEWIRTIHIADLYLSVITVYELEIGIRRIERRDSAQGRLFRQWLDRGVLPQFHRKILSFDTRIAMRAAGLHVPGPRPLADSFIAATAAEHEFILVTRNASDFQNMDVEVLNPFEFN